MKLKYFVIFIILFLFFSCSKKQEGYDIYQVPKSLFFIVKINDSILPENELNNCKLFYIRDSTKSYVQDFIRGSGEARSYGILTSLDIGLKSGINKIKTYYLEYQNLNQDTLFIDYDYVDIDNAKNEQCKCMFPIRTVKFNGNTALLDSSLTQFQNVYIFIKK